MEKHIFDDGCGGGGGQGGDNHRLLVCIENADVCEHTMTAFTSQLIKQTTSA